MTSRGRRCQEPGWLTQLSWRKCARTDVRGESAGDAMLSAAARLNLLFTMHTANSAHLSGAAPRGRGESADVYQRSSGPGGASHQDAMASGAPAGALLK